MPMSTSKVSVLAAPKVGGEALCGLRSGAQAGRMHLLVASVHVCTAHIYVLLILCLWSALAHYACIGHSISACMPLRVHM